MSREQRHQDMVEFLNTAGWRGSEPRPFAGDASNRRYFRVQNNAGHRAVLMDAPLDKGEDTKPFIHIAGHLGSIGLSAPKVFDADPGHGFVLLEDLGDDLFAKWLRTSPGDEVELYEAATDVLIAISRAKTPSDVEPYDAETMASLAGLAGIWYAGSEDGALEVTNACKTALDACPTSCATLTLRDYHAENLIWLPDRRGVSRVGLLDFQDARIGHHAYDLASLIKDARRDVGHAAQQASIQRFASQLDIQPGDLAHALAVQSAQRNLRILGVFARLSLHFGKPHYVELIPRVWQNLIDDLGYPALKALENAVSKALPEPTEQHLNDLRERCGTIPALA